MLLRFVVGLLLSLLVGYFAYKKKNLSKSGFFGAILIGTSITYFGGYFWFFVLMIFFFSSSLLSKYRQEDKKEIAEEFSKGGERDFWQTMANGGLGIVLSLMYFYSNQNLYFLLIFLGSMAAVNADTWATELGSLSRVN